MSRKLLIVLGVCTVVALVLALFVVGQPEKSSPESDDEALLPGLADRVNEIEALEIVGPGGTVASLHRERDRWRLREKHDYEADFARIHELLRDLARARRLEAKTDNPEWFGRLGVDELGAAGADGVAVRFPESELPGVIIGKRDPAEIGRYVRVEDESRAWLIGQNIDLPVERMEWLERAIMDIPPSDIAAVTIRHPGGDTVELRPGDEEGSVWVMLDPPAGREVKPAFELAQSANVLARLNMEDVRPHEAGTVPPDAVEATFQTRDGLVFKAATFSDESGNWLRFRVAESEDSPGSDDAPAESSQGVTDASEMGDREIDVVAIDGRLSPWQFAVSDDRFESLRVGTEDLLVAPDEAEAADSGDGASLKRGLPGPGRGE